MSTETIDDSTTAKPLSLRGKRTLKPRTHRLATIVPERRRYRRVAVALIGRFMRENREEYPCQVVEMSAGGMTLLAPVTCEEGERIVAYLDNLGRIEGVVVRPIEGGFAARILATDTKRERIVNLLTWLINQKRLNLHDGRKHERIVPRIGASKVILPSGDVHDCRVLDVSLSGASIACAVKPPKETAIVLARIRGRIVRHHDKGVAIKFVDLQDPDSIARSFG
ncbi:MAG: PilZ domain-containing protein [Methyloceanibacter sp.]